MESASLDVVSYLAAKGYHGKKTGGREELEYPCFFDCGEPSDSRKRKLYINSRTGYYHCLSGDTMVWTDQGRRYIGDIAAVDGHAVILDGNGDWVDSPVSYFGEQELWSIEVTRNGLTRTIRATDGHRWLVGGKEVLTRDLRPGQKLDAAVLKQSAGRTLQRWRVTSVTRTGEVEPVFCAEVPTTQSFVIDEMILTGNCKKCEAFGGTTLLLRHFGDEPKEVPLDTYAKRSDILEHATEIAQQMLLNNEEMLLYLLHRGLSEETILERRLGYVGGGWGLAEDARTLAQASREDLLTSGIVYRDGPRKGQDFFYNHLIIPYLERGKVTQLRGRVMGGQSAGRYMTGPGEKVQLYNADDLACDEVVVTEGEFDCMVLSQELRSSPDENVRRIGVVGLAGVGAYPDGLEGMLTQRKVYIGFDTDDAGRRGAVKLKDLLGVRARIVELPGPNEGEKKNDWTHFFAEQGHGWQDAYALLGTASGRRLFSVSEAAASWARGKASGEGISTGLRQLDAAIDPGIVPGQLMVILAKTGVGKTLLLVNLAYNMRSKRVLFISLEQTKEEVYERLRRVYLFHDPLASDAQIEAGYRRLMIADQNRLSEEDFEALIEEYEAEQGVKPDVVMVDYLGYYARGRKGGTPYEKVSDAVMQLKAEAKKHRTRVIAPHQVNRGVKEGQPIDLDDARDSGVIEETADFLASIWRTDEGTQEVLKQPSGKLRFTLLKSRHGGRGLNFNLQMDLLTLAIVDDHTNESKRAAEHCYLHWRGVTYDELRAKETKPKQQELLKGAQS